jgi:hypothetical protein
VEIPWQQIGGIGLIGVGIYWIIRRNEPVGIVGYPSSFYVKGKTAIFLGVVAIIIGLIVAMDLPKQLWIDKCLDSGGRYDYGRDVCDEVESE